MTGDRRLEDSLAAVVKFERDGVSFFRRANAVAANPRVKLVFEKLARHRDTALRGIETAAKGAGVRPAPSSASTAYPFDAVAKVECYLCGHVVEEIPDACPRCGAPPYAFEKEFTKAFAWGIAMSSGQAAIAHFEAAIDAARDPLQSALKQALEQERALLREAEGEIASAKP